MNIMKAYQLREYPAGSKGVYPGITFRDSIQEIFLPIVETSLVRVFRHPGKKRAIISGKHNAKQ